MAKTLLRDPQYCSTKEAAAKLGVNINTLKRWLALAQVPRPGKRELGRYGKLAYKWTESDIEAVRPYIRREAI